MRGGWLVSLRSVACRLLPRSPFLFFLRCSAAPLPTFACPSPSFCSFCSSSHPRSIPRLALLLGLLYFYFTETYLCSDTHQNVWFYLHRGSSQKGEAEGDFWSKEYWTTLVYIYIYIYLPKSGLGFVAPRRFLRRRSPGARFRRPRRLRSWGAA